MLNIVSTDNMPNLEYIEEGRQFLNNTLAFSYGRTSKDYSTFDPMVIDMIQQDKNFLNNMVIEMQSMIIAVLKDDSNFEGEQQVKEELALMIALYSILFRREHTQKEEDTLLALHDKFLCLLLSDKDFVRLLKDMRESI